MTLAPWNLVRLGIAVLTALFVAWLGLPQSGAPADPQPTPVGAYGYDGSFGSVEVGVTRSERGPPAPMSGDATSAGDRESVGALARLLSAVGADVYACDHHAMPASPNIATAVTPQSGAREGTGASPSLQARQGAANTAARACSFAGATTVLMADGSRKPIEDVRVGDEVIATDPETGEQVAKTVEHVFVHDDTVTDLIVDGEVIATTEDHPFWSVTDQRFERADELGPGGKVLGADGRVITVSGLRLGTSRAALAYNLSVEGIHTYHVGEAEILVHNVCPWSFRSRLKAAGPGTDMGLPSSGKLRFVPERGYNPSSSLPRGPQNGYIDRFGNEWVVSPSRTPGHPFEWDVQLSPRGREQLGWLSRDGRHVNVSPFGEVTH
jgi:hypothetical protein